MKSSAISFVLPTFNSQSLIEKCLNSINNQTSISRFNYEIIIVDGGSTDKTVDIVRNYKNVRVVSNPLKTGEAGKYFGILEAKYKYICLIDSDNVLEKNYISESIKYLNQNEDVCGIEPIKFGYEEEMGIIDKYCSLAGINDPINLYFGNFDKTSVFHQKKWTNVYFKNLYEDEKIIKFQINHQDLPTIGANGSIFYRKDLLNYLKEQDFQYFFDVDYLIYVVKKYGKFSFIKIKTPIYHYYCGSSFIKFYKKQKRRINDFIRYEEMRLHNPRKKWKSIFLFTFETIFFINFFKSIYLSLKNKDISLSIHSLLCFVTLIVYTKNFLIRKNK